MSQIALIVTFFILLIAAIIVTSLWHDLQNIKATNKKHDERITALEKSSRQRMPFRSQDEVLNAMSALDVLMSEFHFGVDVIENAKSHLAKSLSIGTTRENK